MRGPVAGKDLLLVHFEQIVKGDAEPYVENNLRLPARSAFPARPRLAALARPRTLFEYLALISSRRTCPEPSSATGARRRNGITYVLQRLPEQPGHDPDRVLNLGEDKHG